MEIEQFWQVVESARRAGGKDPDARADALRAELSGMAPAELQSFQNHYDQLISRAYRWDLWGAAYIINGGCSDDGFRYFRDWLISEGREAYEAALLDPESLATLPKVDLAENELYGYVALELFEEVSAGELERDFSIQEADPVGEPWEEEALYAMFPCLAKKYEQ